MSSADGHKLVIFTAYAQLQKQVLPCLLRPRVCAFGDILGFVSGLTSAGAKRSFALSCCMSIDCSGRPSTACPLAVKSGSTCDSKRMWRCARRAMVTVLDNWGESSSERATYGACAAYARWVTQTGSLDPHSIGKGRTRERAHHACPDTSSAPTHHRPRVRASESCRR